jgi:hypothetical protein
MHSSTADRLLARLEGVRKHGTGWRARCPSHGSDRNRSLSIAERDDGAVLLKCFANCDALAIVHAVGLELRDLFPDRPEDCKPLTPAERRKAKERSRMYKVRRLLPELALECRVVLAAAAIMGNGERLALADEDRLVEAVARIENALGMLK